MNFKFETQLLLLPVPVPRHVTIESSFSQISPAFSLKTWTAHMLTRVLCRNVVKICCLSIIFLLRIKECGGLEYIIDTDDEYGKERDSYSILSIGNTLSSESTNFVSICSTNNLIVTWPSLKDFECYECLYPFYGSREAIITSTKGIEQVAVEETIANNTNMAASSILSESATSKLNQHLLYKVNHIHM
ncbi:hypothetical protein VIGAN_UM171400 [Vigna angularis var. angularis]|uniref:Uncharacterized protein n=1 Tax=Vigna angularis var. angularis TaxID=157739 RepID=A0A0S3TF61_PHAAN|nr:hypothetical protein VIGAN_UM171400 [Vigna angularis var. angularis]